MDSLTKRVKELKAELLREQDETARYKAAALRREERIVQLQERFRQREAQLAEMRRDISALESAPRNGHDHDDVVADDRLDDVLEILDRYAIPTEQPNEDVDHA